MMALIERLFPVSRHNYDFFEAMRRRMNVELSQMEQEIEQARSHMFQLLPRHPTDVMIQDIKPRVPVVEEKGETKLKLEFNVKEFHPDELEVKLLGSNILQVSAHHAEQSESGGRTISYLRQYSLPQGIDTDHIRPHLTTDGVLTVEAPASALKPNERMIPIEYK